MGFRFGPRHSDVSMGQYVKNGCLWMSGTNKVAVPSNNVFKCTLAVAGGQAKAVTLIGTSIYSDSEVFTDIHINPTTNLPTTVKRVDNAIMDGRTYTGVVTFKADTASSGLPLSGGITTAVSMAVGETGGGGRDNQSTIVILPGYTIGFNTLMTGTTNFMINVSWIEGP